MLYKMYYMKFVIEAQYVLQIYIGKDNVIQHRNHNYHVYISEHLIITEYHFFISKELNCQKLPFTKMDKS